MYSLWSVGDYLEFDAKRILIFTLFDTFGASNMKLFGIGLLFTR